jgi:ribonuclease D
MMDYDSITPLYLNTTEVATNAIQKIISSATVVGVDLEGLLTDSGYASLIQLSAAPSTVILVDLLVLHDSLPVISALKELLENDKIAKVFHAMDHDCVALSTQLGIVVQGAFDTQVAHAVLLRTTRKVGINVVIEQYTLGSHINDLKDTVQHRPGLWERRPLTETLLSYAAQDVIYLPEVFRVISRKLSSANLFQEALAQTNEKVRKNTRPLRHQKPPHPHDMHLPNPRAAAPPQAASPATSESRAKVGATAKKTKKKKKSTSEKMEKKKTKKERDRAANMIAAVNQHRTVLAESKDGHIELAGLHEFVAVDGIAKVVRPKTILKSSIVIHNRSNDTQVLTAVGGLSRASPFAVNLAGKSSLPIQIGPQSEIKVEVTFQSWSMGLYNELFRFEFKGSRRAALFASLRCGDPGVADILKPKSRFVWCCVCDSTD